jgi:hypothetical protein
MPPTTLVAQNILNPFSATGLIVVESDSDVANGNDVLAEDNLILYARNSGATGRVLTISSTPDAVTGRTGDITATIAAGQVRLFKLQRAGWATVGGKIEFDGAHAELKLAVLRL